jgi:hypothetical protein
MATKLLAAREWGAKAEILGQRAARTFRRRLQLQRPAPLRNARGARHGPNRRRWGRRRVLTRRPAHLITGVA